MNFIAHIYELFFFSNALLLAEHSYGTPSEIPKTGKKIDSIQLLILFWVYKRFFGQSFEITKIYEYSVVVRNLKPNLILNRCSWCRINKKKSSIYVCLWLLNTTQS